MEGTKLQRQRVTQITPGPLRPPPALKAAMLYLEDYLESEWAALEGNRLQDLGAGESASGRAGGMAGGRGRRGVFLSHGNWQPRCELPPPPTHARTHARRKRVACTVGPAPRDGCSLLTVIEQLPMDLRDRFTEMREMDLQVQSKLARLLRFAECIPCGPCMFFVARRPPPPT